MNRNNIGRQYFACRSLVILVSLLLVASCSLTDPEPERQVTYRAEKSFKYDVYVTYTDSDGQLSTFLIDGDEFENDSYWEKTVEIKKGVFVYFGASNSFGSLTIKIIVSGRTIKEGSCGSDGTVSMSCYIP